MAILRFHGKRICVVGFLSVCLVAGVVVLIFELQNKTKSPYATDPTRPSKETPCVPRQTGLLPASFSQAAVACDSALCSTVGKDILMAGGNAVDSAIATLLCNCLTSPQSMGIGGGFFMTIYNRTSGKSTVLDAREVAPARATQNMFASDPAAAREGGLSIAVPGEIKGYWEAHQKYGHLAWDQLFQPAIRLAADGFPVSVALSEALLANEDDITTEPSLRSVFVNNVTDKLFQTGEIMRRPQLAATLRAISLDGMAAFYNGSLTEAILHDLADHGSIIQREDLLNYRVIEKSPLEIRLKNGVRMLTPPPPSGGAVLAFILNILDGYDLSPETYNNKTALTLTYHRIVETFKLAYAKRTDLGDEHFIDVTELAMNLTSRAYADQSRRRISDTQTHDYDYYGGTYYSRNTTGTSHLSVLDQEGTGVAVTSTINQKFGSKRRGLRTGIIFNDEMDDFSSPNVTNLYGFRPSPANFIAPGKRPLSSMSPSVFVNPDGSVATLIGAAGGSKIITTVAWVVAHTMWLGKNIREAIDLHRLHHQLLPDWIQYEKGFDAELVSALVRFGHTMTQYDLPESFCQGIHVKNGTIYANSDFRKGGQPDGF